MSIGSARTRIRASCVEPPSSGFGPLLRTRYTRSAISTLWAAPHRATKALAIVASWKNRPAHHSRRLVCFDRVEIHPSTMMASYHSDVKPSAAARTSVVTGPTTGGKRTGHRASAPAHRGCEERLAPPLARDGRRLGKNRHPWIYRTSDDGIGWPHGRKPKGFLRDRRVRSKESPQNRQAAFDRYAATS
jgi:hypothetical protein